ncbi:MAG TPA: peptidylprolyl isomerase [Kofleriaceae bacterium]|nr:peptidylprolyl isomerase [Kofleriaceae bacterium]
MTKFSVTLVSVLAVAAGCEHKSKNDERKAPTAGGAANANGTSTNRGEQGGAAAPAGDMSAVRAPTAADLAVYLKDIPGSGPLMARIETTKGTLNCELYGDKVPMTVANFVGLATGKKPYTRDGQTVVGKPFYDGLTFHRVIPGFMIQGGDPEGRGSGGPGYQFAQEIVPEIKHAPGVLSMANAGPNTNGSQFFVMEADNEGLNGGYNAFGKCKEVDIVKTITGVPRGERARDMPNEPVIMTKVTITRG